VRKPNPFVLLKSGKKNVVVAAVDAGSISFYRFGQGGFEELPMT
jgi:tRNA-splicing endonuclease subunit Sen54